MERHHKVLLLACQLGVGKTEAIGLLHRFWWWVLEYAEDGQLRKFTNDVLGSAVELNGEKAKQFVQAMTEAGFLDREPCFRVHDWWDYAGRYLQGKYGRNEEKWKAIRDAYKQPSNNVQTASTTVPNLTVPKHKNMGKSPPEKPPAEIAHVTELPKQGEKPPQKPYRVDTPGRKVVAAYKLLTGVALDDRVWDATYYPRFKKSAEILLKFFGGNVEQVCSCMEAIKKWAEQGRFDWTLETVIKRASDWKTGRLFEKK